MGNMVEVFMHDGVLQKKNKSTIFYFFLFINFLHNLFWYML